MVDWQTSPTDPSDLDLKTLDKNVEKDAYPTMEEFKHDVQKIFDNCRVYNAESTPYSKCAKIVEDFFKEKLRELDE